MSVPLVTNSSKNGHAAPVKKNTSNVKNNCCFKVYVSLSFIFGTKKVESLKIY